MNPAKTSCGVIVGDGERILLGHATRSPRWDIPKGEAEPGEDFAAAAMRELQEETGLSAAPGRADGARRPPLSARQGPRPVRVDAASHARSGSLVCSSTFALSNGTTLPEFDRFGLFAWDEALNRVGKNMARVLGEIRRGMSKGASE